LWGYFLLQKYTGDKTKAMERNISHLTTPQWSLQLLAGDWRIGNSEKNQSTLVVGFCL